MYDEVKPTPQEAGTTPKEREGLFKRLKDNAVTVFVAGVLSSIGVISAINGRNPDNGSGLDDGKIPAGQPTQTPTFEALPVPEAVTAVSQDVLNAEHAAERDRVIATQVAQDAMTNEAPTTTE